MEDVVFTRCVQTVIQLVGETVEVKMEAVPDELYKVTLKTASDLKQSPCVQEVVKLSSHLLGVY